MFLRRPPRSSIKTDTFGSPQLNLARLILRAEKIMLHFGRPLLFGAGFVALAWLGVFEHLYPWIHLLALIVFVVLLFDAIGRGRLLWRPVGLSEAKRRVEAATGLSHRPLDVIDDRPVNLDPAQRILWQIHVERAKKQLKNLNWPSWNARFAEQDPYALRYGVVLLLALGCVFGWGALGGRLIDAINPALGKQLHMSAPTLDAWITPPEYTGLPPVMIATPADIRHNDGILNVPEGSMISAHLAERDSRAPVLIANNEKTQFTTDSHGDFEASALLKSGDVLTIRRGWQTLGSWHIHIVPDTPPEVAFTDPPSVTEHKSVRLAYEAKDDYGVTSVTARLEPRQSLPGENNNPIEISLATTESKDLKRVNFEDLSSHSWAGQPVSITLIAQDASGHSTESEKVDFTLPERAFFQPVARALIDERKKLLQQPDDDVLRSEAANIMATIAHQPQNYHGDPVVLMALRSGAVRLVLDHGHESALAINDILWQSALRIESGGLGTAEQNLHEAQKDLADALDRNASEQEIQQKIDRLHQALAQYLAQLSTRVAQQHPVPAGDLNQILGPQTNMLTPNDLERMLNNIRDLSATHARDAARQQLAQLQQLLENMNTDSHPLSEQQKQQLQNLSALRAMARQQQQLLDKTFQKAEDNQEGTRRQLSHDQQELMHQLQNLMSKNLPKEGTVSAGLSQGADAMKKSDQLLGEGSLRGSIPQQNNALQALQKAAQSMADELRASMMMLPGNGKQYGQNKDPFGRDRDGFRQDDDGVKVPDQLETHRVREIMDELQRRSGDMRRSKTERDYMERLLQNF